MCTAWRTGTVYPERLSKGKLPTQTLKDIGRNFTATHLEKYVIESPCLCGEDGRHTLLALLDKICQVNCARTSVPSSPRLPRLGVGCVAISAKRLAVYPRLGDSIDGLRTVESTDEIQDKQSL